MALFWYFCGVYFWFFPFAFLCSLVFLLYLFSPGFLLFWCLLLSFCFLRFFRLSRAKIREIILSTPEMNVSDAETLVFDVKSVFSIVFGVLKKVHFFNHFGVFSGVVFGIFVVFILDFFSPESCFSGYFCFFVFVSRFSLYSRLPC